VIKINGKIIGGGDEIKTELEKSGIYIIEAAFLRGFKPATLKFCPLNASFDSPQAKLTKFSENAYLLEFILKKVPAEGFFSPVSQLCYKQKGLSHTLTLFFDGFYYAQFENDSILTNKKIYDFAENVTLSTVNLNGETIASVKGRANGKKYCLLAAFNGEDYVFEEIFADIIEENEGRLSISDSLGDMACRLCRRGIEYDGTKFITTEKKFTPQKPFGGAEKLLPYYFLEAVLYKDFPEAIKYLSETNYKDVTAQQLKNFFGDFTEVTQNRYEGSLAKYPAVIRRQTDSFFVASYYDFVIKDGLIENIISVD
jgi:hypothetical protein